MMAAHEVLSGVKKGSRGHCLRVSETPSRWRMLRGGMGRVSQTTRPEASQQFAGGCQRFHGSESNQPNCGRKTHLALLKMTASFLVRNSLDHKRLQSESTFGKRQYLLVLSLRSACRPSYWPLSETG